MGFLQRSAKSDRLIELLSQYYWNNSIIKQNHIFHEIYGYETHISTSVQEILKRIYTKTAKHIRFTPDYIVGQSNSIGIEPIVLIEYKVTTTPRYTLKDKQWDIGQIEADAWDNYINLANAGVKVAILIYCPYHPRPLLCDFPNDTHIIQARQYVQRTQFGSGTPYCNINLRALHSFDEFMQTQFNMPLTSSKPLIKQILNISKDDPLLQITHAEKSEYRDKQTGFNWLPY